MNLFDWTYISLYLLPAIYVTLFVSAVTVIFEVYFTPDDAKTKNKRRKLLLAISALVWTILLADFSLVWKMDWQKILTQILMVWAFAVLFYQYLGGKYVAMLFLKLKKMLPGNE